MQEQHHELPTARQQTDTTPAPDSAASCRIRSPYPAPAPGEAEASGAGAPGSFGPGVPNETGGESSLHERHRPAPRRRLRDKQLRERRVHPRYSDAEFALVQKAAALSRMKPGGYVAECALAAARADDPTAAVADYRTLMKTLMAANGQLGKVGSNLNQLTWHLHQDGAWPHTDTVQRLLARVEASIAELDAAVAQITEGR